MFYSVCFMRKFFSEWFQYKYIFLQLLFGILSKMYFKTCFSFGETITKYTFCANSPPHQIGPNWTNELGKTTVPPGRRQHNAYDLSP